MRSGPTDTLVGRGVEIAFLQGLVAALADGQGAVVVVEGEAGIGKTRLLDEISDAGGDLGAAVHRGEAHPFDRARPFGPIVDALGLVRSSADPRRAELAALLAGAAGPADVGHRVIENVVDLLETACRATPVVLLADDLQWADRSTLLALDAVAHRLSHVPFLLAISLRPAPRRGELDRLVERVLRVGASSVALRPLRPEEVEELAARELGGVPGPELAVLLQRSGGNPLWIVEMARSLDADGRLEPGTAGIDARASALLPDSFRALVLRRLGDLPPPTIHLLRTAAVLGDAFSVRHLAAVAQRTTAEVVEGLGPAYRARILQEEGDTVAFRHQLVQDAIYQDLPRPLRRAVHREAAAILATTGASRSEVADHVVLGADRGDMEAIAWLREAAVAAAPSAPAIAVDLLRRAESLRPGGHPDAELVTVELVVALLQAGDVAEAAARAEVVLDRQHRRDVDLPLRLALVSALSLQNRAGDLIARAEATLSIRPDLTPADQSLVLAQASYGRTFSGDVLGGEEMARRAVAAAERAGDVALTTWGLTTTSVALKLQGRYAEALALSRRAVDLAFGTDHRDARLRHPLFFLGMALADADDLVGARQAFDRAIDECDELGSSWLLPDILLMSAEARLVAGSWDDARSELESGLLLADQHGQRVLVAQSHALLALLDLAQGRAPDGTPPADLAELPDGSYGASVVRLAAASRAAEAGDDTTAYELLLAAGRADDARSIRHHVRLLAPALVRLAMARGEHDSAAWTVAVAEAAAAAAPTVPSVRQAHLRCAALHRTDPEAAQAAADLARASPRLAEAAATLEDTAAVMVAAGQAEAAKEHLLEALATYDALGAAAWASRAASGLRALGVRRGATGPRHRSRTGWASLTTTERSVSCLVAEGLTNREVARRLHLSPHTVNSHLRHVFQKLQVSNRTALAARVLREDGPGPPSDHSIKCCLATRGRRTIGGVHDQEGLHAIHRVRRPTASRQGRGRPSRSGLVLAR
ncbi:MAG: AAA family ATPase [Acidimicrobiales bacterium]|nr:AAA family ATPase [Acidimicrobiales bacterium]